MTRQCSFPQLLLLLLGQPCRAWLLSCINVTHSPRPKGSMPAIVPVSRACTPIAYVSVSSSHQDERWRARMYCAFKERRVKNSTFRTNLRWTAQISQNHQIHAWRATGIFGCLVLMKPNPYSKMSEYEATLESHFRVTRHSRRHVYKGCNSRMHSNYKKKRSREPDADLSEKLQSTTASVIS